MELNMIAENLISTLARSARPGLADEGEAALQKWGFAPPG
jgi:hypothetical protein